MNWYIRKAVINKWGYYICTIVTIICPVISGVVCMLPIPSIYSKILSGVIMGISTIAAALLPLFGYKKKWGMYRNQAEQIKAVIAEYISKGHNDIVSVIEKVKLQTHEEWMQPFRDDTCLEKKSDN